MLQWYINDIIMMLSYLYSNVWVRVSTQVVEGGVESLALTETCPDIKEEEEEEEEEEHGQNGKIIFRYNFPTWCCFTEIFSIQLSFHVYSNLKSSKV